MPGYRVMCASAALLLVLSAGRVLAAEPDSYRQGIRLYKKGRYSEALERFEEARSRGPTLKIQFNIGRTLHRLNRLPEAAEAYERARALATAANESDVLRDIDAWLAEIRGGLGRIVLQTTVKDAEVRIDGRLRGRTPLESAIYVEPGLHAIAVRQAGGAAFGAEKTLAAGQELVLPVTWPPPGAASRQVSSDLRLVPVTVEQENPSRRRKSIIGYSALGAGLALVATAAVLYGAGFSQGNAADEDGKASGQPAEYYDDVRSRIHTARSELIAANVLVGVGAAAVGLGLYTLLTRPGAEERPVAKQSATAGLFVSSGIGVGLSGSF